MDRARAINLPPVVVWVSVALIGAHVVRQFLGQDQDEWVLLAFAFLPARYGEIGMLLPGGEGARFWSPVTYAFLHADFLHLLVNVIWMASFGGALARRFGSGRFLLLSLVSAVAGAGLHYLMHPSDEALVIGASGAVSGMMAGTARFAFSPGGPLAGRGLVAEGRAAAAFLVPAEPLISTLMNRRALAFILIWFAVNLVFGFAGGLMPGVSGPIAWEAHVGGFLAGLLFFSVLDPVQRDRSPDERLAS